jgi:DNA invertase Pin-like site-specific DNA recombinase
MRMVDLGRLCRVNKLSFGFRKPSKNQSTRTLGYSPLLYCLVKRKLVANIGYARIAISEDIHVLNSQKEALKAAGCARIFEDSEGHADQPALKACLECLRRGDVLVVLDLDRFEWRAGELIHLVKDLESRGVGFCALKAEFDTTTSTGRAFLRIEAAFADMERNLIRQRIRAGVAAGRARGRKGGRPRLMTPERLRYAQYLMTDQTRSIPAIYRELGEIPPSTLYHYLHPDGSLTAPGRKLLHADAGGHSDEPHNHMGSGAGSSMRRLSRKPPEPDGV